MNALNHFDKGLLGGLCGQNEEQPTAVETARAEELALVVAWNRDWPQGALVKALLPGGGTAQGWTVGPAYLEGCMAYVWIKGLPQPVWLGRVVAIEEETQA